MSNDNYTISYGPGLIVKDRPHRVLDTSRGVYDSLHESDHVSGRIIIVGHASDDDAVEIVEPRLLDDDLVVDID